MVSFKVPVELSLCGLKLVISRLKDSSTAVDTTVPGGWLAGSALKLKLSWGWACQYTPNKRIKGHESPFYSWAYQYSSPWRDHNKPRSAMLEAKLEHSEDNSECWQTWSGLWAQWTSMRQGPNSGLSQHLSKRLRAFEKNRALKDCILYRDERYFQNLEASPDQAKEVVVANTQHQVQEVIMTAPLEEKGDSGPLVACKVFISHQSF